MSNWPFSLTKEDWSKLRRLGVNRELARIYLSERRVSLVRAPAGIGKTKSALAVSLILAEKGYRIGFFFRTIKEIEHALSLLQDLLRRIGKSDKLLVVPVVGKRRLCMFPPENEALIKYWCQILSCYFFTKRSDESFIDRVKAGVYQSIKDYYELAKKYDLCPYYAYSSLAKQASILLTTHVYFIDEDLYEKLGKLDVIFIDEAHNLMIIKTGEISVEDFELGKKLDTMREGREDYFARDLWEKKKEALAVAYTRYSSYVRARGFEVKVGDKLVKFNLPANLIMNRLNDVKKIILTSASLYPTSLFNNLFLKDVDSSEKIVLPGMLKGTTLRRMIGLSVGLTTSYKKRNKAILNGYIRLLNLLRSKTGKNMIVFAPSKEIAKEIVRGLSNSLLVEDSESVDLGSLKDCEKAIFVSYMRGSLAEGVELNFGYCSPKILVVVGLPYPAVTREMIEILKFYSDELGISFNDLLDAYHLSNMVSALVQAAGRVGRREKGIVLVVDDRLKNLSFLGLPVVNNINKLVSIINGYLGG